LEEIDGSLESRVKKAWKYPILDGIVNQERFSTAKYRLLWVLKEPNKASPDEVWDHREFHRDVSGYDYWEHTYKKIIYTSFGILFGPMTYRQIPFVDDDALIQGRNVLEDVAIININKGGGTSVANDLAIQREYVRNRELIRDQIEAIDPHIIINASRVWDLFFDLKEGPIVKYRMSNFQYSASKRLVINTFHPNSRYSERAYCENILRCQQRWSLNLARSADSTSRSEQ